MNVTQQIEEKIKTHLSPIHLEVINESHKHAGHAGDDGSGESHFKLIVVSDAFMDRSRIQRHKMVFTALDVLIKQKIHALEIKAFSKKEYDSQN